MIAALAFFSASALGAVTCSTVSGVYTCTDGTSGVSTYCQMVGGTYVCSDTSTGTTGNTCVTNNDTGATSCINMSGGGGDGGLSLGAGLGKLLDTPQPAPSSGWLSKATWWLSYAINVTFRAVVGFLKDLVTYVFGAVLGLVALAVSAIGVPSWISQYSLGNTLGQTGAVVAFFMGSLQIPLGLTLIGGGYTFRLVRKLLTVFQW